MMSEGVEREEVTKGRQEGRGQRQNDRMEAEWRQSGEKSERVEEFEQNEVGRCLEMHHNVQCEECGWASLPPFLLQGSVNGMRSH